MQYLFSSLSKKNEHQRKILTLLDTDNSSQINWNINMFHV
jgi:hypothetical protein